MSVKFRLFFALVIILVSISWSSSAYAHAPAHLIDSANIDQYTRLEVGLKTIHIHYILNMGDFPAYLERRAIDTNVDAKLSPEEQETYLNRKIPELMARLSLKVNNSPVALKSSHKKPELSRAHHPRCRRPVDYDAVGTQL